MTTTALRPSDGKEKYIHMPMMAHTEVQGQAHPANGFRTPPRARVGPPSRSKLDLAANDQYLEVYTPLNYCTSECRMAAIETYELWSSTLGSVGPCHRADP